MAHFPVASDLIHELDEYLHFGSENNNLAFQRDDFNRSWDQQEPLDPELAKLFPDLLLDANRNAVASDHDYFHATSSPSSSDDIDKMIDSSSNGPIVSNADPVLASAIDAPEPTGVGIDIPELDLAAMFPIDDDDNGAIQGEEDTVMYTDEDDDDHQEVEKVDASHEDSAEEESEMASTAIKNVIVVEKVVSASGGGGGAGGAPNQRRRRRKPKANAWSREVQPKVSAAVTNIVGGRPKLYEQRPFDDPELERCRLNAICAKQNRDRKRAERQDMEKEVKRLRSENVRLRRQEASAARRLTAAEEQLRRMRELLRTHRLEQLMESVKCDHREEDRDGCRNCSMLGKGKSGSRRNPRRAAK